MITIIIIVLRENSSGTGMGGSCSRVLVLPLFAMMTAEQQKKVFDDAPKGNKLILMYTYAYLHVSIYTQICMYITTIRFYNC